MERQSQNNHNPCPCTMSSTGPTAKPGEVPAKRTIAARAWLEQLIADTRSPGAGFDVSELADAFEASLAKVPSNGLHKQRQKMTERFLRIIARWRGRIDDATRDTVVDAAAILNQIYGDRLRTFAGASACFARSTLELEAAVDLLQKKLKILAELDGGADKSFARWIDHSRKNSQSVRNKNFRRLLKQVLRGQDDSFTDAEIKHVIFRYMDRKGCGEVDKTSFSQFIYSNVPRICEHAAWLTGSCLREAPAVVVEIRLLSARATKLQILDIIDQGFERAMGADIGIWLRRATREEYHDANIFQRARVTDIICYWNKRSPETDSVLIRQGFVEVPLTQSKRPVSLLDLTRTFAVRPTVWIRRNSKDAKAICNIYAGYTQEMVPCQDFQSIIAGGEDMTGTFPIDDPSNPNGLHLLTTRSAGRSQTLDVFVRKLRTDGANATRDLELEFAKIASNLGTNEKAQREKREKQTQLRRLEKIRLDLIQQLYACTTDILTSAEECIVKQLPDTELLVERARDILDNDPDASVPPRHITHKEAQQVFEQIGIDFGDDASMTELLNSIAGKDNFNKHFIPMKAFQGLFVYNPARIQQLLVEVCRVHGSKVIDALGSRPHRSKVDFAKMFYPILVFTAYEFQEWEVEHIATLFADSHRPNRVNLSVLRDIVIVILNQINSTTKSSNEGLQSQDSTSIQDFIVNQFSDSSKYTKNFSMLTGRRLSADMTISLGRFKSIVRKHTLASDEQLIRFLEEHQLNESGFISAAAIHVIASRLVRRSLADGFTNSDVSSQVETVSTISSSSEVEDSCSTNSELGNESDQENEASKTQKQSGPGHIVDWINIRRAICETDAFSIRALLKSSSKISEKQLIQAMSRSGIKLSETNVREIIRLAKDKKSEKGMLSSKTLLRLFWPAHDVAPEPHFRTHGLLQAARKKIQQSLLKGLGAQRILADIVLYDAGVPENFTLDHLVKLIKRVVPKSGLENAHRKEDALAFAEALAVDKAACGEHLLSCVWEFLISEEDGENDFLLLELCLRDYVAVENPIDILKAMDTEGSGLLTQREFSSAMQKIAPCLPMVTFSRVCDVFKTSTNRIQYDGQLISMLQLRPKDELPKMLQLIQDLRYHFQRLAKTNRKHYIAEFRARDSALRGVLTREVFREILEVDLGGCSIFNEQELQMLLRWVQSTSDARLIDYERFVRMLAPTFRQVDDIIVKLADHLRLRSQIVGGELDIRGAFAKFDRSGTGHISRANFEFTLSQKLSLCPEPLSKDQVQLLLDNLDPAGHDMVDYVKFSAQCLGVDREVGSLVAHVGQSVRLALVKSRIDPRKVFMRYDKDETGEICFKDFIEACRELYLPCSPAQIRLLLQYFGWIADVGDVVQYENFVDDLIRAGGPGGLLCKVKTAPPESIPIVGQDRSWNSFSIQQWLASGRTPSQSKAKFIELYRSIERSQQYEANAPQPPKVGMQK